MLYPTRLEDEGLSLGESALRKDRLLNVVRRIWQRMIEERFGVEERQRKSFG